MASPTLTRRTVLNTVALATTALAMPFVRGAHAAGKLSCGFWDHWVPGANEPLAKLCREWADREKVELTIDFITSQGDKLALTATAEAQARSGHDVLQMADWYVAAQAENLAPVDELVTSLLKEHGKLLLGSEYIGKQKGRWIAVPTGVQTTGQTPCARIDHFKQFVGLDLTKMYPAGAPPDEVLAEAWTWDGFLAAAEKCARAGYPFGMPLSTWSDSVNWVSAVFAAQGAQLVDGEGNITVKSDEVKEVLAWFKKIVPFLPPSVFAWDNAANNKWLISGQGRLDHEPAGRLGGSGARCACGGRAAMDVSFSERSERPLRPVQFRLLGDLEFFCQLSRGEEPPDTSVYPHIGRKARRRESWRRYSAIREAARFQDVGRRKATSWHAIQLSAARRCDRSARRLSSAN